MINSHSVRLQSATRLYLIGFSTLKCRHLPIWRSYFRPGLLIGKKTSMIQNRK